MALYVEKKSFGDFRRFGFADVLRICQLNNKKKGLMNQALNGV